MLELKLIHVIKGSQASINVLNHDSQDQHRSKKYQVC